jgi:hypothetical protein
MSYYQLLEVVQGLDQLLSNPLIFFTYKQLWGRDVFREKVMTCRVKSVDGGVEEEPPYMSRMWFMRRASSNIGSNLLKVHLDHRVSFR